MPLPDRPSLEFLRKLAKDRLQEMRRSEHDAPSWRALRAEVARRLAGPEPDRVARLHAAIRAGDAAAVEGLLGAEPALADARDEEGSTLTAAVDAHRAALIPLLLRHGADPHLVYAHSAHTPLSWAVTIEAHDCARALVAGGVEPDLYAAAGLGDVARVRAFFGPDGRLRARASITGSSRYAADGSRLPCPPETEAEIVADALYVAARGGQEAAVRELLAHGPDLSFRAFAGATSLHWAYFGGVRAVVALLLAAGADPALRDPVLGCTPEAFGICFPASVAWVSRVRRRLAEDPRLVGVESARGGPLHEAAHAGALEAVKALMEAGADPARRNAERQTALDLARARPEHAGCVAVAEWLAGSAPEPRR